MKIKILRPCVVNGKPQKPGKKEVTVSKRDGDILVSLGKAEDLTPKKELLTLTLNTEGMEVLQKENEALKAEILKLEEAAALVEKGN